MLTCPNHSRSRGPGSVKDPCWQGQLPLLFAPNLSWLPWSSLIYGNEGFHGDFLMGFKGRSRVISPAATGESDRPPGRASVPGIPAAG